MDKGEKIVYNTLGAICVLLLFLIIPGAITGWIWVSDNIPPWPKILITAAVWAIDTLIAGATMKD